MDIWIMAALLRAIALADPARTGIVGLVQVGPDTCMVDYQNSNDNQVITLSSRCPEPVVHPANEWMLD